MNGDLNVEWIAFHLEQAQEVLTALQGRVEAGTLNSMEDVDLGNSIAEAWGNLNAAWNGRRDKSLVPEMLGAMSEAAFHHLREAPEGLAPV